MVYFGASDYSAAALTLNFRPAENMPMRYSFNLKAIRQKRGLKQQGLADILGVEQPTVQRWESGARRPDADQLVEIADALGVPPGALFMDVPVVQLGPTLWVKGEVAAGVWKEAFEWPEGDWQTFTGRADVTSPLEHRFGLVVRGDSMNEVYPAGTIIECVSFLGGAEIASGKRVVVVRRREDLEYEATVKEYLVDGEGRSWLVPRSTNPAFQRPIAVDSEEPGIIETRIAAIVVSSSRPE